MANANDEIFENTLDQQLNTLRVSAPFQAQVLRDLRKLERSIIDKINELSPEDANGPRSRRLNALLREVNMLIDVDYKNIDQELSEELTKLASIESTRQSKILADAVGVSASSTALPPAKLNNLYRDTLIEGAPSSQWWSRQSDRLKRLFEDEMRQGVLLGETNQQLIQRVRGTRAFNFTNGIMNVTRNNAEALVRSSVQAVANATRFETLDANSNLLRSYRHVSTLDSRTSTQCIVRDNKRWKADTKEPIGHNVPFQIPPIHWNCRSTLVGEVKGTTLPDDADRESDDGPVPANTSFEDFLDKKSKKYQDDVLGPGKADLWREGKINLTQLLDQRGNPLTLEQLTLRYG
jgi:SPP1 gp7 family putative phage head morphogenesis protein